MAKGEAEHANSLVKAKAANDEVVARAEYLTTTGDKLAVLKAEVTAVFAKMGDPRVPVAAPYPVPPSGGRGRVG